MKEALGGGDGGGGGSQRHPTLTERFPMIHTLNLGYCPIDLYIVVLIMCVSVCALPCI